MLKGMVVNKANKFLVFKDFYIQVVVNMYVLRQISTNTNWGILKVLKGPKDWGASWPEESSIKKQQLGQ